MDETDKIQIKQMIDDAITKALDFSTRKRGDTPTDDTQLTPKGYVDTKDASVTSTLAASIIGIQTSIAGIAITNIYGPGIHSVATVNGVDSIAGISPSSSIYTLNKDVFFTDINFSNGGRIKTNGYRIFANGTITISSTKSIYWDGNNASGQSGGASLVGMTVPGALGGSNGGSGGPATNNQQGQSGSSGTDGVGTTNSIGSNSTGAAFNPNGGNGGVAVGRAGGPGASPGSIATATVTIYPPYTLPNFDFYQPIPISSVLYQTSASAPGGGGGGSGGSDGGVSPDSGPGGYGGGGGGNGGTIAIFAKKIVNTAVGGISANGGSGADGQNGQNAQQRLWATGGGGGGGGGNGGTGGVLLIVYNSSVQTGTFTVSGGSPGVGGGQGQPGSVAGGSAGLSGKIGNTGNDGKIWLYQV